MKAGYESTTCSLAPRIVVHWVGFFDVVCVRFAEATFSFIGTLVDVKVGSRRQTSTFDFRSKELSNRIVSHLLYSKLAWVVRRIGHVWPAHLVNLGEWVGNISTWLSDTAIIRNIRYYCGVASARAWGVRNIFLVFLLLLGMCSPLLVWSCRFRRLKCL